MQRIATASFLLGLMALVSACVIAPAHDGQREGYYDHDHNRYYHENSWHDCGEHDDHCH
jgi:hypothetical protein